MSTVFYASMQADSRERSTRAKVAALFDAAGFAALLRKDDLTAVKLHFGERGNDGFINPIFVRSVVDRVRDSGANPFLTDTNTLYSGMRSNAADHATTAILHGFGYATAGAPIVIADGLRGENERVVTVGLRHFATAFIAGAIGNADSMIVLSHFKGHQMAGFGGAIKNISIGIASSAGKAWIHSAGKTRDRSEVWENLPPQDDFLESMAEAAKAVADYCGDRILYISVANNLSVDCDCVAAPEEPKMGDLGILASLDPVALDRACVDRVRASEDHGKVHLIERIDSRNGMHTLDYAERLGMGSQRYELVELD